MSWMFALKDRRKVVCVDTFTARVVQCNEWNQQFSHQVVLEGVGDTESHVMYEGTEAEVLVWYHKLFLSQLQHEKPDTLIELVSTTGSGNGISEFVKKRCEKRQDSFLPIDYVYAEYLKFARDNYRLAPMALEEELTEEMHSYPNQDEFPKLLRERIRGFDTIGIDHYGQFVEDIVIHDSLDSPVVSSEIIDKIHTKRRQLEELGRSGQYRSDFHE